MDYEHDSFYNTNHLSVDEKKKLLYEAKEKSYDWHVDKLDCKESFNRKSIEMEFEEVIEKMSSKSHFVFIHRRGYKTNTPLFKWRIETGFSSLSSPNFYLFINMEEKFLDYFIKKYNLKEL